MIAYIPYRSPGGTSLNYFARERQNQLLSCNVTISTQPPQWNVKELQRQCVTRNGNLSRTPEHCFHNLNPNFVAWSNLHPISAFCFVRNPVVRFISNYNFRFHDEHHGVKVSCCMIELIVMQHCSCLTNRCLYLLQLPT